MDIMLAIINSTRILSMQELLYNCYINFQREALPIIGQGFLCAVFEGV
nr:MAG TPA: hypothetical protein [Caudoviricetes sp.]